MSLLQSLFLGLIQGLTEFLPISSSAHLVFFQHVLGFSEPLLFYDVVLHLGTLAGLCIYFAGDLSHMVREEIVPPSRLVLGILVATVPTGVIGVLFKDAFEQMFGSLRNVGFELLATTLILWLTRYFQKGEKGMDQMRVLDFFVIGVAQGVSIIPGISRSGATIAAALFLGVKREDAFRFSFLLAIPAILGAGLLEFKEGLTGWTWGGGILASGFLIAAVSGYLSLHFLSRVMRQGKLYLFAWYTAALGLAILFLAGRFE